MATYLEQLQTAQTALAAKIATDVAKDDYSIDGQAVSRRLLEKAKALEALIASAGGPVEEITEGYV